MLARAIAFSPTWGGWSSHAHRLKNELRSAGRRHALVAHNPGKVFNCRTLSSELGAKRQELMGTLIAPGRDVEHILKRLRTTGASREDTRILHPRAHGYL